MAEPLESDIGRHARALEALRPEGLAWTTDPNSIFHKFLEGLATELARVTGRAGDLLREADPQTTIELVEDWERVLGLPGEGLELEPSLILRQFAIVTKLTAAQGQSPGHFIAMAASLGFAITVEEYLPFRAGKSKAGDPLTNGDWMFTWTAHVPEFGGQWATAGNSQVGEALLELNQTTLITFLELNTPAHTKLLIAPDGPWVGWAPWTTIYPEPVVMTISNPTAVVQIA